MNGNSEPQSSKVAFEPGTMVSILSRLYPTPLTALYEGIQNAVDSKATSIVVEINLKRRTYFIEDNGNGMSLATFADKVGNIGASTKIPGVDYGKFGIGMLSFYGKFETYVLTTAPKEGKNRPDWEGYHCHNIGAMTERDGEMTIPYTDCTELKRKLPPWNTQVYAAVPVLRNARLMIRLSDLTEDIAKRFGEGIEQNGAKLTVVVIPVQGKPQQRVINNAPVYRGQALKAISTRTHECGRIAGQLYFRSDKGGTFYIRPGHGLNRLTLTTTLIQQLTENGLKPDVLKDLASGWFDGEISPEAVEMQEDRQHLVENEAMISFLIWLHEYYHEHLERWTRSLQEDAEQRLDQALLTQVAEALRGMDTDYLGELFGTISSGAAISKRHTQIPETTTVPDGVSKIPKQPAGKPAEPQEPKSRESQQENKQIWHIDVVDNPGHAREFSKNQVGIRLCFDDLRGSSAHFEWEPEYSLLMINRRHPDYVACKGDADRKSAYLETIVKIAISMQLMSAETEGYSQTREALVKLLLYRVINPISARGKKSA